MTKKKTSNTKADAPKVKMFIYRVLISWDDDFVQIPGSGFSVTDGNVLMIQNQDQVVAVFKSDGWKYIVDVTHA